jgi:23S rRNA pseudouridine1911/1915/1917 synthase
LKTIIREPATLLQFLIRKYPDSPRTRIKKLLQSGAVRINNEPASLHSLALNPGDIVEITKEKREASKAGLPFPVIFEDQSVIIIDKPPGIPTSGGAGSIGVQQIVAQALKDNSKGKLRSYVVHRLDKEVSGILLLAKSEKAMNFLKDHWKETDKHYYAVVEGVPPEKEGTIRGWLFEDKFQKVHSTTKREGAKFAITHYRILKILKSYTLLDVKTETGRKNQIRVHLSGLGNPIVGDIKYGASALFKRRIRLHACKLSFPHPENTGKVSVELPLPAGFLKIDQKDEHYKWS